MLRLPNSAEEYCNCNAQRKGSQDKKPSDVETDSAHHQKTSREKKPGKFRVHSHRVKWAGMTIGIAVLHLSFLPRSVSYASNTAR